MTILNAYNYSKIFLDNKKIYIYAWKMLDIAKKFKSKRIELSITKKQQKRLNEKS